MIGNYSDIMAEWAAPSIGSCTDMMQISPDTDMRRWAVTKTVTVLANSDYYYTKDEVDNIIERVLAECTTVWQVEAMINAAIASKADKADVEELQRQMSQVLAKVDDTYSKEETNALLAAFQTKLDAIDMRDNYSRIEGSTLVLNSEFEI